jgi:CRP/FNR family transcriptional regulator, anaerobic regulatory protein
MSVCSVLPKPQRATLAQQSHVRHVQKGDVIAHEGDSLTQVASIISGVVKMTKTLNDGRQQIVGLGFPSDLVGRPFAETSRSRVEAATDVTLCSFQRAQFEHMLRDHPDLEHFLLKAKLDELDVAKDWMLVLGRKTARERVATFLLMLVKRRQDANADEAQADTVTFELPLTRTEMADYLGLALETVSRQLSRLSAVGLISLENKYSLTVRDVRGLAAIAGAE